MKTIIVFLAILTTSILYGQSSIVYDSGTNIDVSTGADVCASTITVNGTYSGNGTFCNGPVDVEDEKEENFALPKKYDLAQNYPNPFNPSTVINFQLPTSGHVRLIVYDLIGNEVAGLVNEEKPAGYFKVEFNASKLASGIYFYKLKAGEPSSGSGQGFVDTKKMILIK